MSVEDERDAHAQIRREATSTYERRTRAARRRAAAKGEEKAAGTEE
jgi:hypothetical protein